jgi:hypothetical protein
MLGKKARRNLGQIRPNVIGARDDAIRDAEWQIARAKARLRAALVCRERRSSGDPFPELLSQKSELLSQKRLLGQRPSRSALVPVKTAPFSLCPCQFRWGHPQAITN